MRRKKHVIVEMVEQLITHRVSRHLWEDVIREWLRRLGGVRRPGTH